jgi:NitT/TauT family transport system permease protein
MLPIFESALMPLMIVLMVTPIVAIAPALVIAFGFGNHAEVHGHRADRVFYPMLVNSLAGLRDVDHPSARRLATLHANRWEVFRRLRVPSSMPFVFAGCASPSRSQSSAHHRRRVSPRQVSRPAWAH